jgi:hypothetical protein
MTEFEYVKKLMIDHFVSQFSIGINTTAGSLLNSANYDIRYIPAKKEYPIAFEVYNRNSFTSVRLRAYLSLNKTNYLEPYTLVVTHPAVNNALGDEVFATVGTFAEINIKAFDFDIKKLTSNL